MKTFIKKNNKIIFFLNIFFLLILLINHSSTLLAIPNFENHSQHDIKLSPTSELERRWLTKQPKMQVYEYNILKLEHAIPILKRWNINISQQKKYFNEKGYSYYPDSLLNKYKFSFCDRDDFLTCYFIPRDNPFHKKNRLNFYSNRLNHITCLEDLLFSKEHLIEKVFIFWDSNEKIHPIIPKIHLIEQTIEENQSKEDTINNYLIKNNIIKQPKRIFLNCYNPIEFAEIAMPFSNNLYNNKKIEAIYFDEGMREIPKEEINDYSINDLLKLSNGAKNIYLFTFNTKQKEIKNITLPDNQDPYNAIRTWKRENKLYAFPPLTKQNDFITEKYSNVYSSRARLMIINGDDLDVKIVNNTIIVSQQFETANVIYNISCSNFEYLNQLKQDYKKALEEWQNQCYIQKGQEYSGIDIREKFGISSKWIYDSNGRKHWYQFNEGWLYDDWSFLGRDFAYYPTSKSLFTAILKEYNDYYDTTEPPKKPKELD